MGVLLEDANAMAEAFTRIENIQGDAVAGALREEYEGINDTVLANWAKLKNMISAVKDLEGQ